jgi:hypothetical protein
MNEQATPNTDPEIIYPVKGEKLIDYISAESARKAEANLQERADRQTKLLSIILSLFAFLGLGGVFGIVKYAAEAEARKAIETQVPAVVESRARALVDEQIKGIRTQLQDELLLSNFKVTVDALNAEAAEDKGFSESTRDDVMSHFREVAVKPDLVSRAQFKTAVRNIVKHFWGANQGDQLDEIHSMASKTTLADTSCVVDMVMHYGRTVVGSPYTIESLKEQKAILDKYLTAAGSLKYPELALFWRILLEFKAQQCQRTKLVDQLVLRSRDLDPKDEANFYKLITQTSDAKSMANQPTQEILEMARVVNEFRRLYSKELDEKKLQQPSSKQGDDERDNSIPELTKPDADAGT